MKSPLNLLLNYFVSCLTLLLLAACGGGGGGETTSPATPTITGVKSNGYAGMIASPSPQNITVTGTNFSSGMTLTIRGAGPTNITVSNPTITATTITTSQIINPSPNTNRFITVDVKTSTDTVLASPLIGVANQLRTMTTDIQTSIFEAYCTNCHSSGSGHALTSNTLPSGNTASADFLLGTNNTSTRCSQKRVTPGDPTQSKNVLLDVLYAKTGANVMTCNASISAPDRRMPQGGAAALSQPQIDIIADWIAGGAR